MLLANCGACHGAQGVGPGPIRDITAAPGCAALLAEAVLERDCGSCHGQAAREAPGLGEGMTYIDDMAQLLANGQVIACASSDSPLLFRAQDGSMPPPASRGGFAVKGRDLAQVSEFIDGLCLVRRRQGQRLRSSVGWKSCSVHSAVSAMGVERSSSGRRAAASMTSKASVR